MVGIVKTVTDYCGTEITGLTCIVLSAEQAIDSSNLGVITFGFLLGLRN